MSVRLLRACAVKMLMEPAALGGTSASYSLEFTRNSGAAIVFTAECAGELGEVAFTKDGERSRLPFAPSASTMDDATLRNQYKDAATALAITRPGRVVAIGAEARGKVFLAPATVSTGTPIFSVGLGSVKAIRLAEDTAITLQMLLGKNYHEAAYGLLKSLDRPASPALAAQARQN